MKKILSFLFTLIIFAVTTHSASAEDIIKSYQGYTILNKKLSEILPLIDAAVEGERNIIKLNSTNTYYWSNNNEHVYLRVYAANDNTDLYIVADTPYAEHNNSITDLLKSRGYEYKAINDEEALKEYKFDFVDCARSGALDGLFVLPDYIKPLKNGVGKVNARISKFSKKNSAIPYTEDNEPINLTCVDTKTYSNTEAQVKIIQKEYRLKNKENKYVHAFEYVLHNEAESPINIDKVTSEKLASIKDVEADAFVDIDRLNVLDFFGSFPPAVICTCGLSLIGCVPNMVRTVNLTKESVRYAHLLPENYNLPANHKMRILVLKYKNAPKPLNFTVTRGGQTYTFSF
ncbi:MAG: hypothetical protein MJ231_02015 [bacterium]|nr:hypothetical protein [bacterium]